MANNGSLGYDGSHALQAVEQTDLNGRFVSSQDRHGNEHKGDNTEQRFSASTCT
jgi:hypothetical protein